MPPTRRFIAPSAGGATAWQPDTALVPSILAGIGADRQLMQADGIHPAADAQGRMLDNVWPQLHLLFQVFRFH